jgi:hypothetical protein
MLRIFVHFDKRKIRYLRIILRHWSLVSPEVSCFIVPLVFEKQQYSSSQSRASPETKRHVGSSPGSSVRTVATQPYAPRMGGIRRAEEVSAAQLEKAAATEESPKSSGASDAVR